jgi:HEPN domain-containing protein
VGFHAQQAVEKALNAVLASASVDFPFTHNIAVLMQLCDDEGFELPPSLAHADPLTPYGVAERYGARSPGTVDRATALGLAVEAIASAQPLTGE